MTKVLVYAECWGQGGIESFLMALLRRYQGKLSKTNVEHFKGLAYYFKKRGYLFQAPHVDE